MDLSPIVSSSSSSSNSGSSSNSSSRLNSESSSVLNSSSSSVKESGKDSYPIRSKGEEVKSNQLSINENEHNPSSSISESNYDQNPEEDKSNAGYSQDSKIKSNQNYLEIFKLSENKDESNKDEENTIVKSLSNQYPILKEVQSDNISQDFINDNISEKLQAREQNYDNRSYFKNSKIPDNIKGMCEIIEEITDFYLYECFKKFNKDDTFNKMFSDELKSIKSLNENLNDDRAFFDMELHYLNDENFDYGITVFKGKAKLLENIHYTHSFFKSGYYCCINKAKDLWINKGDEVYWHRFKNYDPNYSILKKEIFIHLKKRHYNCAEFHFKHNCLLCFKAVYKYMPDMNMRLYDLFDCDKSR